MVFGAKAIINTTNFVGHDQIWKDHVTNEWTAAKQWPQHWGFLIKQYKEVILYVDESMWTAKLSGALPPPELPLTSYSCLATDSCTIAVYHLKLCHEDQDVPQGAASVRVKQRRENLRLPPISNNAVKQLGIGSSTRRFPQTSSAEIGWRSTQPQCHLERYGRHCKPLPGLLKSLNWPPESVD